METSDQRKKPNNIKVIGFDLDNTLYPSTQEIQTKIGGRIYERLSKHFRISFQKAKTLFEDSYNQTYSGSKTLDILSKQLGKEIDSRDFIQNCVEEAEILDLIESNPRVCELFQYLKTKADIDLITGSRKEFTLKKLERIGISTKLFGYILTRDLGFRKNSGEVYQEWIRLRKTLSENMLYVGDNKRQDVDVPKELGIQTCIIGEYKEADFELKNILELRSLFY